MEPQLALPPSDELEPGHDDAYGGLEVVEVKEEEGKVLEDEKKEEKRELSTPNRSTTGPLGSATGPTEGELFKSGGSKESLRDSRPKGKPMMLAPLAPPQPQTTLPLFTQEQLRESKAAARKAPQIYGRVQATSSSNEELHLQVKRPAFLKEEERFEEMKREDFERWKRGEGLEDEEEEESEEVRKSEGGDRRRRDRHQQDEEEIMWRWHMSQEVQKLTDLCHHQQKENDRLQQELYERRLEDEVRRRSEEERMKRLVDEKPSKTSSTFNTPEEGKMPDPTMPEARGRTPWSTYPTRYGMKGSRSRSKDTRKGRSPSYGKGAREDSKGPPWTRPTVGGAKPSPEVQQMEVMTLLVESMKALQKQISEGHDAQGTIKGVEVVRQLGELPTLGPMHGTTSQLQLGDWLLFMQPVIADLTATSDQWWDQTLKEVEKWYQAHQNMAPLDRVRHEPIAPASLNVAKWAKLERRMATLMLKAIPEAHRDEVVAMKRLSVFAILAHLHTSYCPGGVSEMLKSRPSLQVFMILLLALEDGYDGGQELRRLVLQSQTRRFWSRA